MSVTVSIPFETLVNTVEHMSVPEKIKLSDVLEEELAQVEESFFDNDPVSKAEMQEAREAFKNGDYVTLDEFKKENV